MSKIITMDYGISENEKVREEDQMLVYALHIANSFTLSITLTVALQLRFFDIISRAGHSAQLSASEVVSQIPTKNPRASLVVDRMLNLLATHSLLTCELRNLESGLVERVYGIAPPGKFFVTDSEDGVVMGPYQNKGPSQEKWEYMKDAVLEGIIPFEKACGMSLFEFTSKEPELNHIFNKIMAESTKTTINNILVTYQGFENVNILVDVGGGGGLGICLGTILSKYPHIKGINFDLPHIIETAHSIPGVEHIGGDMFQYVPAADVILMKSIIHDFDDESCLTILHNCHKALSESGKVIIVTTILQEAGENSVEAKCIAELDINILSHLPGRERTKREFRALAEASGFRYNVVSPNDNSFTGEILIELGNCRTLVWLDLKTNNLTGEVQPRLQGQISDSFSNLSFLVEIGLSNNLLTGQIPQRGQLSTLPATQYENNPELCGVPLPECKDADGGARGVTHWVTIQVEKEEDQDRHGLTTLC
ncbi:caffeic acid 3-O-methyltransferase-like [Silene latifolia]|uniref:caffeic acid 3-O-methyltransferase-like n=1 Tax=Silene latifolia TaxID=37657 RepID=UPI003D7766EF